MLSVVFVVLRYLFLTLMLVFLISLVGWMVKDLRAAGGLAGRRKPAPATNNPSLGKVAGAAVVVLRTSSRLLSPGDIFALGEGTVIGRSGDCDIVTGDSFTSARHARIFLHGGQYWLEDLGSKNGTYLNGVKVDVPAVLADGDGIEVGGTIFQFVRWGA